MHKGQTVFIKNWLQYQEAQPAVVTKVNDNDTVNLQVFSDLGAVQAIGSVKIYEGTEAGLDEYLKTLDQFGRMQMFAFE